MKTATALAGCFALFIWASHGQNAPAPPAFEAASLRMVDNTFILGVTNKMTGGPGTNDPSRITYTQVSLRTLLLKAWGLSNAQFYRLAGPSWIQDPQLRYSLTAIMPPDTTGEKLQLMLQNLLIERFKIKLHHETRQFPGYDLVVAPGGPTLKEPANPDAPQPARGSNGELDSNGFLVLPPGHGRGFRMAGNVSYANYQNFTMAEFVPSCGIYIRLATGEVEINLVDKTGLKGKYDFQLKFDSRSDRAQMVVSSAVAASMPPRDASSDGDPSGVPSFFKALEQQLGLRFVKVKAVPQDVIVIDGMERTPIEN